MTVRSSVCPDLEALRRFLLGEVSDQEIQETECHLTQCPKCVLAVEELEAADVLVEALQAQAGSADLSPDLRLESMIRRLQGLPHASADTPSEMETPSAALAGRGAEEAEGDDASAETYRLLCPPQGPDEVGRLGAYRVLGVLGTGGMGVVFRAEDPQLGRLVALKALRPALLDSPIARQRFLREARAAAAVEHEHVVHINEVGEDHGVPFVAMPLLQGESLEARLRREGRLPVAEVVRIGRETAEGLAAAHARGLIHRDVKPANIWLEGERGKVKLLDFGLARLTSDDSEVTRSGYVVGTPAFMAPEQAEGGEIDVRADLFSLGCVLYWAVTGRLPFRGTTVLQVLRALATEEPTPPRELNPQMPAPLEQLIGRLLDKDPARRPASAQEAADALNAIATGEPGPATPRSDLPQPAQGESRRKAPPRWVRKVCGGLLLVVLAAGAVLYGPSLLRILRDRGELEIVTDRDVLIVLRQDGQRERILHVEQSRAFDVPAGQYQVEVVETPAGALLSSYDFQLTRGGRMVIAANPTVMAGEPDPTETPAWPMIFSGVGKPAQNVAFSPDGRLLAAAGNGKVMVWELATRKVSVVLEGERACYAHVAFSPDGKQLAASEVFSCVRVWSLADGKALTAKPLSGETKSLAWRPDGKRLLSGTVRWFAGGPNNTRGFVQAWNPDSGETTKVFSSEAEQVPADVAYSPDGRLVAASMFRWSLAKNTAFLADLRVWDAATGTLVLTLRGSTKEARGLAFSPDGKQLARGAGEGTVERWEVATGQPLPSLRNGDHPPEMSVAFSPDGRRLVSGGYSDRITVWDLETVKPHLVLRDTKGTLCVAYSPDGRLVASAEGDGLVRVWDVMQVSSP